MSRTHCGSIIDKGVSKHDYVTVKTFRRLFKENITQIKHTFHAPYIEGGENPQHPFVCINRALIPYTLQLNNNNTTMERMKSRFLLTHSQTLLQFCLIQWPQKNDNVVLFLCAYNAGSKFFACIISDPAHHIPGWVYAYIGCLNTNFAPINGTGKWLVAQLPFNRQPLARDLHQRVCVRGVSWSGSACGWPRGRNHNARVCRPLVHKARDLLVALN